ncbi:hypothetical protein MUCCIDRAFT_104445 [Mucor lusitanicus CBS 277.49]|uniref:Uncharacterized protein n=1 Tax=Mucor lusitanicus CBS 277.49 TaxID=747725 RepID=A0A162R1V6_MUCCL|nr:hypothetical protein MUCCIDRAFT_104445 [Mucor lusitanicus CBS 277.49]
MHSRKRKSYSPRYQDDDDEEDIWEREASIAASSIRHIKPTPPNPYAAEMDVLNNQYQILEKTETDLQQELAALEASLQALEQEEINEQAQLKRVEDEYLAAAQEAIALYESRLKNTQDVQLDETITISNDTPYLKSDTQLIKEIKRILQEWESMLTDDHVDEANAIIDTTVRQYRKSEFDIMDLNAQISGLEAKMQILERDRARLNSLPQILPILRSETETYAADMEETAKKIEKLEKDVLRPYLARVVLQSVFYPLYASFLTNEIAFVQSYLKDLESLYDVSIKQRSYQQLTTLLYEKDASLETLQLRSLETLVVVNPSSSSQQPLLESAPENTESDDKLLVKLIKGLLKKALKQTAKNTTDLSLAEQIKVLQDYAKMQNQKWHEDFQSCQEAAAELISLHRRLSDSLYSHSKSTEELIMVPKPYTTLQEELEFRTMEIKTALSMLEKVIVMQHVLGGYGSRTNNVWVSGSEQQRKEIRI